MTTLISSSTNRPMARWITLAGVATFLMIPFSASAHASDNGALEVLVSAGVAYAVIDAAGGFDKDRRHDRHRDRRHDRHHDRYDRYHHGRHDHRHRDHDRRYWAYSHHGRHDCRKHGKGRHHADHHRGSDWRRDDGRRYRLRAYH